MKLKVEVTQEDINNGVRQDSEKCPIACALKRLIKNPEVEDKFIIGCLVIEFELDGVKFIASLTDEAVIFIANFDHKGIPAVKPFSFEIEAYEKNYDSYE